MSVSSRRRPRRQRRGGRGHSQSAAFGRAGPPGEAAMLRAGPGRARGGGRFVRGAASPGRAGPGDCGALAAAAPGRLHFVPGAGGRGTRRPGAAALSPASRRRQALGAGGGGDALRGAARAPASRGVRSPRGTSVLAGPRPAPRLQHAAIWRLARPGLAPKVGREPWRLHAGFSHPCWGGGRVFENKEFTEHPQTVLFCLSATTGLFDLGKVR